MYLISSAGFYTVCVRPISKLRKIKFMYCHDFKFSESCLRVNIVDPEQTWRSLIRVSTVCCSVGPKGQLVACNIQHSVGS